MAVVSVTQVMMIHHQLGMATEGGTKAPVGSHFIPLNITNMI